uniref:Uncharacterized protein n=1 Tax=Arundo donax TaxID=35708 RepID=A0A0A9AMM1_ARUDO
MLNSFFSASESV